MPTPTGPTGPTDPTDPVGSILIQKVSDAPPCGARMPKDGTPLTAEEITCLKVWITAQQPLGTGGSGMGGGSMGGGSMGGGAG